MKTKDPKLGLMLLAFLPLLFVHSDAHAAVYRLFFDVYTANPVSSSNRSVAFTISVSDTQGIRDPEAISSLEIITPAITSPAVIASRTLNVPINDTWNEFNQEFNFELRPSDFQTSSGIVPYGRYTLRATMANNTVLTSSDILPNFNTATSTPFLGLPTVIFPSGGTPASPITIPTRTPVIRWGAVAGAEVYRIQLMQASPDPDNPVYFGANDIIVSAPLNSFAIRRGVLKRNTVYAIRIEARDSDKNLNRRSRTNWTFFRTPLSDPGL